MEILLTRDALVSGYWFATEDYCKEWEKFSVVDPKSKLILLTSMTKAGCIQFIDYLENNGGLPEFYRIKVNHLYKRLQRTSGGNNGKGI